MEFSTLTVRPVEEILLCNLEGQAVILNLQTGAYYGLDEVGNRMWELLSQHRKVGEAYRILLEEYEVEPQRLREDLMALIDGLSSYGLLQINPT